MKVELTIHAIERFQERIAPHTTFKSAKKQLLMATQQAKPLKQQTSQGHTLWIVSEPSMRLVIKADKRAFVCVTVLPPDECAPSSIKKQQEIAREYEVRLQEKSVELLQLENFLKTAKSQEQINLAQKREILALEHQILSEELSTIRSKEKTLQRQLETQSDQEVHKRALRFALRAIFGEISCAEALDQISSLDEGFLRSEFYKAKLTKAA